MTLSPITRIATLIILAAASVSTNASASPTNVPFSANFSTAEYLLPGQAGGCPAEQFAGITVGIGNASFLGISSVAATDCITPLPGQFMFSNGKLTFTAANGDTLRAEYQGSFVQLGGATYTLSGATFRFVGGTGRFAKATGGGQLRGTEELSSDFTKPSTGKLEAIGTISF